MATPNQLKWASLTRAINEIKSPASFLKNMLYGVHNTYPTSAIELDFWRRGRMVAPFVKRGSPAFISKGHTEEFNQLTGFPHIRIKRPMKPTDLFDTRRPGTSIFIDSAGQSRAIAEYMAREMQNLDDDISNAEEYMVAQALRGQIAYSNLEEESFTITFPRSATHDITLTGTHLWTDALSDPRLDFSTADKLTTDDVNLNVTDVILGDTAAEAFIANTKVSTQLNQNSPQPGNGLRVGSLDLTQAWGTNGAMLLSPNMFGKRVWRYSRKLLLADGTQYDLIRPDHAEFIAVSPAAEWELAYGPTIDFKAFGDSTPRMTERFSKSWEVEDPSVRWILAESNPLPWPRRPDASVSMKVV